MLYLAHLLKEDVGLINDLAKKPCSAVLTARIASLHCFAPSLQSSQTLNDCSPLIDILVDVLIVFVKTSD